MWGIWNLNVQDYIAAQLLRGNTSLIVYANALLLHGYNLLLHCYYVIISGGVEGKRT